MTTSLTLPGRPRIRRHHLPALLLLGLTLPGPVPADVHEGSATRADPDQVRIWNRFVDRLYQLHLQQVSATRTRKETRPGGYAPGAGGSDFYREESHYAEPDGHLLSRIRWENHRPHSIHSIQVYLYDAEGRVSIDYHAGYLPRFQNAPMNTYINVHDYRDELHAFRQFDATGRRLFERCRGTHDGESVWLELEYFPVSAEVLNSQVYDRCFGQMEETVGVARDPLHASSRTLRWPAYVPSSHEELDLLIEQYDGQIAVTPLRGDLHIKRGDAYFLKEDFRRALADYNAALEIDDALDEAYFGRGMARARLGRVAEGIRDLDVFMERNPGSSLAHTKRGIRYLWLGDAQRAEQDFREALRIDPDNAEAHSDLGVILAQRGDYGDAVHHMQAAVRNDPTYQKAFHNLAMVHYLQGRSEAAMASVERALALNPRARDSLMLKSEILKKQGDHLAAEALRETAQNLPKRDWSERAPVR